MQRVSPRSGYPGAQGCIGEGAAATESPEGSLVAGGASDCVALEAMRLALWECLSGGEWPAAARGTHLAQHTFFTQSQAEHLGLLAGKVPFPPL